MLETCWQLAPFCSAYRQRAWPLINEGATDEGKHYRAERNNNEQPEAPHYSPGLISSTPQDASFISKVQRGWILSSSCKSSSWAKS